MTAAGRRRALRAAVLVLATVVGAVAWLTERSGEDAGSGNSAAGARIVRPAELADAAVLNGHPVYWAGPVAGTVLALSEDAEGSVQVRYLPAGSEAG
jgi:hypothetical protein